MTCENAGAVVVVVVVMEVLVLVVVDVVGWAAEDRTDLSRSGGSRHGFFGTLRAESGTRRPPW